MGRVALVTGVSGGIGSATARLFQAEGWQVVGVDLTAKPDLCLDQFIQADLASPDAIDFILAALADSSVDALINNAAVQITKSLRDTSLADWDQTLSVNLRAAGMLTSALADGLKESKGAIVNVASVHAISTSPGLAPYVASKGGLVALTRAAAMELAPDVRVNAVLPGAVDTRMLQAGLQRTADPARAAVALADSAPLRRIGKPDDIAQAILFLADGARSGFITGQSIVVDGGATARLSTE